MEEVNPTATHDALKIKFEPQTEKDKEREKLAVGNFGRRDVSEVYSFVVLVLFVNVWQSYEQNVVVFSRLRSSPMCCRR
jgi:hypothetical protein